MKVVLNFVKNGRHEALLLAFWKICILLHLLDYAHVYYYFSHDGLEPRHWKMQIILIYQNELGKLINGLERTGSYLQPRLAGIFLPTAWRHNNHDLSQNREATHCLKPAGIIHAS